ncbi:MAG: DUF433 domain-containing protein [Bryobacterales bacterium]|nr:DUF433 domain-containing protein [Bryobacterales bacterium]MBV9396590.1 DUF433 domain-containing protein [Bryobacterales bacterium]
MSNTPNSEPLSRLRELVTSDPEIMRGTPVFKGTRIPVDLVADMLAQGATAQEILEGYPPLSEEMISLAPLHTLVLPMQRNPNRPDPRPALP